MHIRIKIYYTQIFNNLQTISALFKRKGNKQKIQTMKKTILYFLVVPFVMLILSLTCTKEEGADCHKRFSTKKCVRNTNICY